MNKYADNNYVDNNNYVETRTEAPAYCNQTSTDGKKYEYKYILTE